MPVPSVPRAAERPHDLAGPTETRVDPWYWLRERDDPEVIEHLEAENEYTESVLAGLADTRQVLFEEIRARIRESDASAAVLHGPFAYFTRTEAGSAYPIWCRRRRDSAAGDGVEVLLDPNRLAQTQVFFEVGSVAISPDHSLLAYTFDTLGDERYTLRIRDLERELDLEEEISNVYYGLAWSADSRAVWFVRPDHAMRPYQVWRHDLGGEDTLVHTEADERFFVRLWATRSGSYGVVALDAKTTSERWLLDTAHPAAPPVLVEKRRADVEYEIDHQRGTDGGRLVIVTNDAGQDFRVVIAPVKAPDSRNWVEAVPHTAGRRIEAAHAFDTFIVLSERERGLEQLRLIGDEFHAVLDQPEAVYTVGIGSNFEPDADRFRINYSSLATPDSAVDIVAATGERIVVKQIPVEGDFELDSLVVEQLWATAQDGTQIPISLVRAAQAPIDGTSPLLLYGYGSYESSIAPAFSHTRLSLLERGVSFAIAHVRGGGEMGRAWYDAGRLGTKMNTFTDFVACAEHLIQGGYTSADRLAARGRSAGGLLMGAVANLRPELFRAIVAEVPFVDVLTTMQDPSLPLTVTEWEEWGDPRDDPVAYRTMRAYSPFDNVAPAPYPAILATAGVNDSRVQYWEPTKWVQRLRKHTTSDAPILLHVDLGAGHSGPSGRYEMWRYEAFVLAFVLDHILDRTLDRILDRALDPTLPT